MVVSNPRHTSTPTTDLPRDLGVVGRVECVGARAGLCLSG